MVSYVKILQDKQVRLKLLEVKGDCLTIES